MEFERISVQKLVYFSDIKGSLVLTLGAASKVDSFLARSQSASALRCLLILGLVHIFVTRGEEVVHVRYHFISMVMVIKPAL